MERRGTARRIWELDHTLWREDPREISDRLGWLTVTTRMRAEAGALEAFAREIVGEGYRHVVLLGMGGSSLGPEVLRQTFPPAPGYPELMVLDSTVPAQVRDYRNRIDPARTLFLVSSKSVGTAETHSFYRYFRQQVEEAIPAGDAGQNFVAITDPGTSLESLAQAEGFRRAFANPPDIGGRYSVLSYFGLVPAAMLGVDLARLLDRADEMRDRCAPTVPANSNPGAQLGALMAGMAESGRDKLTLITPQPIASFGLWAEQLLAESLGKEGKGIIPVAGEPLLGPGAYGDDRLFVYLAVSGEPDAATERAVGLVAKSGNPVARLTPRDRYDLGAEFFRWEFATAVAGALLDLQPFDQPDVRGSKDNTDAVLASFLAKGAPPDPRPAGHLDELLAQSRPGDYLAIMAYIPMSEETDSAFAELRQAVMERRHIATTLGYGPRFLHSTGQLHKGGPDSGLYLQLTMGDTPISDQLIPGEPYGFGTLAAAQAIGDFQALQKLGRRAVRVDLGADPAAGIRRLLNKLG